MGRVAVLAVLVATGGGACTSAHFLPSDGGPPADGGPDAPHAPPTEPARPAAPRERPRVVGTWLPDTEPSTIASASPVVGTPSPPSFGDCAPWSGGGAEPCEPWPASGMHTCTGAEAHFPGEPGCRSVGSACPTDWATDLPAGATIYVRAGATGGDGTAVAPFGTLAAAVAAAGGVGGPVVVALAPGSYAGSVTLPDGVALWGACPAGVVVRAVADADVVIEAGDATGVHNLSVTGGTVGIRAGASASVTIDRVVVESMSEAGVRIVGGSATATDLVVRRTRGTTGRGLELVGGTLDVERGVVSDLAGIGSIGLAATSSGHLDATNLAVHDVEGLAADTHDGGSLELDHVAVERTHQGFFGLLGGRIGFQRGVMRDLGDSGVNALSCAELYVRASLFSDVVRWAVAAGGTPTTILDVIVRDVTSIPGDVSGSGLAVWGGTVGIDRVLVERTAGHGVSIWEDAAVTASSLDVIDTGLAGVTNQLGAGVQVTDGASLALRTSRMRRTRRAGVMVGGCILGACVTPPDPTRWGNGASATLTDVRIDDVAAPDALTAGHGIFVTGGTHADVTRVEIRRTADAGLAVGWSLPVNPAGTITLLDVTTSGGALAQDGGGIDGSHVVVLDGWVEARGTGSSVDLADVVALGAGALGTEGGAVTLERTEIASGAVSTGGALVLTDTTVDGATMPLRASSSGSLSLTRTVVSGVGIGTAIELRDDATGQLVDVSIDDAAIGLVAHETVDVDLTAVEVEASTLGVALADRGSRLGGTDILVRCAAAPGGCAGLVGLAGGGASLVRVRVEGARGLGVGGWGAATSVVVEQLSVGETALGPGDTGSAAASIGAYDGASVRVTGFRVEGSAGAGAELGDASAVFRLEDGVITGAAVGLELAPPIAADAVLLDVAIGDCPVAVSSEPGSLPLRPVIP